jgi:hypothetical protein
MYCHIIRTAYALCLGKPICNSICNGDKCCFDILVGVGFFRGGRVAMLTVVTNEINKTYIILEACKEIQNILQKLYKVISLFIPVSEPFISTRQFICQANVDH